MPLLPALQETEAGGSQVLAQSRECSDLARLSKNKTELRMQLRVKALGSVASDSTHMCTRTHTHVHMHTHMHAHAHTHVIMIGPAVWLGWFCKTVPEAGTVGDQNISLFLP